MNAESSRAAKGDAQPAASLHEISRVLEETARILKQHADASNGIPSPETEASALELTPAVVRAIIKVRQLRADYFPAAAGDPAWAMILELFAVHLEGRRVSQSKLAIASRVPHSTALRLTKNLIEEGLVTVEDHPGDGRLLMLGLSDETAGQVRVYLTVALATVPYVT
jgi:DNA repair protein RadC